MRISEFYALLKSLSQRELEDAVEKFLLGEREDVETPIGGYIRPVHLLVAQIRKDKERNRVFARRMRRALGALVSGWRLGRDPEQYLADLVLIASLYSPSQLKQKVLRLLAGGEGRGKSVFVTRGRTVGNVDLHSHLLRSLTETRLPRDVLPTLRVDLCDARYCAIAYRLLACHSPENIGRYFVTVVETAAISEGTVDLASAVGVAVNRLSFQGFYELLRASGPTFTPLAQAALERALLDNEWSVSRSRLSTWVVSAPGEWATCVRLRRSPEQFAFARTYALSAFALRSYDSSRVKRELLKSLDPAAFALGGI